MSKKWVHRNQIFTHPGPSAKDRPQDWVEVDYDEQAGTAAAARTMFEMVNESGYPLKFAIYKRTDADKPRITVERDAPPHGEGEGIIDIQFVLDTGHDEHFIERRVTYHCNIRIADAKRLWAEFQAQHPTATVTTEPLWDGGNTRAGLYVDEDDRFNAPGEGEGAAIPSGRKLADYLDKQFEPEAVRESQAEFYEDALKAQMARAEKAEARARILTKQRNDARDRAEKAEARVEELEHNARFGWQRYNEANDMEEVALARANRAEVKLTLYMRAYGLLRRLWSSGNAPSPSVCEEWRSLDMEINKKKEDGE